MATATTEKMVLPRINEAVWVKLRKQFRDRLPAVVDDAYLRGVLSYNEASSDTLIRQLKRVGLINDEGKPTDLANRWRNDQQYAAVCEEIVDAVYPPGLRDAFPDASASRAAVASWMAHTTRSGEGTAQGYARFYLMLLQADASVLSTTATPPKTPRTPRQEAGTTRQRQANAASGSTRTARSTTANREQENPSSNATQQPQFGRSFAPSVHLDFQIHIAPDSAPELIDSVFASMAKHLRSLLSEASE